MLFSWMEIVTRFSYFELEYKKTKGWELTYRFLVKKTNQKITGIDNYSAIWNAKLKLQVGINTIVQHNCRSEQGTTSIFDLKVGREGCRQHLNSLSLSHTYRFDNQTFSAFRTSALIHDVNVLLQDRSVAHFSLKSIFQKCFSTCMTFPFIS